ncbi:glycosyltransferase family 2 protein [Levilactobacillus fujinensis]|uniref:Glycosyltransferase family 2 protein n=1 Tax=Levilactobacillus fujinensis TaxID=2486024 RepID=A0ABW1TH40_9LACO|nr:glycosyltransferase family 2 protein [Levilactobacillus fujinensis]
MKKAEDVAILMSTFNGADYIEQQINTIRAQSYTAWTLYIRDDGSTDTTVSLIRQLMLTDQRIVLCAEPNPVNLGPARSFMTLLAQTEADYYLFADQDDFWLPDKIEKTLNVMRRLNQHDPNLVHTNLSLADKDLNVLVTSFNDVAYDDVQSLLLANDITGCTVMINRQLRELVRQDCDIPCMHDMWLGLRAVMFGNVAYLKEPTILYRQHGSNVVGSTTSKVAKVRTFNSPAEKERLVTTVLTARTLLKRYGNHFSAAERQTLLTLAQLGQVSLPRSLWRIKRNRIYKHSFLATASFILKLTLNYSSLKSNI